MEEAIKECITAVTTVDVGNMNFLFSIEPLQINTPVVEEKYCEYDTFSRKHEERKENNVWSPEMSFVYISYRYRIGNSTSPH